MGSLDCPLAVQYLSLFPKTRVYATVQTELRCKSNCEPLACFAAQYSEVESGPAYRVTARVRWQWILVAMDKERMSQADSADEGKTHWFIDWVRPNFRKDQYLLYVLGCVIFSFGANFFIYSKLGTDPLDVLSLGMTKHLHFMTVGLAQGGFALLCLAIWSVWNKRLPLLSPFVTFFFCGTLIDLWMGEKLRHGANVASLIPLPAWPLMISGVFLCAYGSALIIMSGIGIRSMDLVAITMVQKWKTPFWLAKGVMEVFLLATGWLLDGPLGWGTLFFLGFVGWLIQPLMWLNAKFFRMRNYGLK